VQTTQQITALIRELQSHFPSSLDALEEMIGEFAQTMPGECAWYFCRVPQGFGDNSPVA